MINICYFSHKTNNVSSESDSLKETVNPSQMSSCSPKSESSSPVLNHKKSGILVCIYKKIQN